MSADSITALVIVSYPRLTLFFRYEFRSLSVYSSSSSLLPLFVHAILQWPEQ
jgi:hypothetical protein